MPQLGSADYANQFITSRGGKPNATSGQYWADRWNEWGKNDPAYYQKRLAQADELTGGPKGNPAAMAMMQPMDTGGTGMWRQLLMQSNEDAMNPNVAALGYGG